MQRTHWMNKNNRCKDNIEHVILSNGNEFWSWNNYSHRENDGPTAIYENGSEVWRKKGKLQRENGLFYIDIDGTELGY